MRPRHASFVVLPTLALVGWLTAQGAVALVSAAWLPWPRSTAPWAVPPPPPRPRLDLALLERLTGVHTRDAPAPASMPPTLASCAAPRRLLATLVDRREHVRSFAAIVSASGRTELLEAGASSGEMRLARIDVDAVVVEENGVACVLPMFERAPAPPVVPEAAPSIAGIRTIDERTVEIDRAVVERIAADPTPLFGEARAIPHEEDGHVVGYRLYGIRAGSLTHAIGLRSGDTVRAIDGTPTADVGALLALAQRMRAPSPGSLRRGEARTIELRIR